MQRPPDIGAIKKCPVTNIQLLPKKSEVPLDQNSISSQSDSQFNGEGTYEHSQLECGALSEQGEHLLSPQFRPANVSCTAMVLRSDQSNLSSVTP